MCNKTNPKHPNLFHKTVIREHCNKKVKRKKYLKNALTHTRHDTHKSANISRNFSSENPNAAASHVPCRVCDIFLVSCKFHQGRLAMMRPATATQFKMSREKGTRNATHLTFDSHHSVQQAARRVRGQRAEHFLFFSQIVECSALFACAFFTFISVLFFLYLYTLIVCSVRSFLYVPFPFVCFGFFRFSDYFYVFNLER